MLHIPTKKALLYPEQVNIKISKELKDKLEILDGFGKDVPEFLRGVITKSVDQALTQLGKEEAV